MKLDLPLRSTSPAAATRPHSGPLVSRSPPLRRAWPAARRSRRRRESGRRRACTARPQGSLPTSGHFLLSGLVRTGMTGAVLLVSLPIRMDSSTARPVVPQGNWPHRWLRGSMATSGSTFSRRRRPLPVSSCTQAQDLVSYNFKYITVMPSCESSEMPVYQCIFRANCPLRSFLDPVILPNVPAPSVTFGSLNWGLLKAL